MISGGVRYFSVRAQLRCVIRHHRILPECGLSLSLSATESALNPARFRSYKYFSGVPDNTLLPPATMVWGSGNALVSGAQRLQVMDLNKMDSM